MNVNIYINGKAFDTYTTKEKDTIREALTVKMIKAAGYVPLEEVANNRGQEAC